MNVGMYFINSYMSSSVLCFLFTPGGWRQVLQVHSQLYLFIYHLSGVLTKGLSMRDIGQLSYRQTRMAADGYEQVTGVGGLFM